MPTSEDDRGDHRDRGDHSDRRDVVSGIILAAGASRRMGQAKQLLRVGDRPLLQHVIDLAGASCLEEIVVVLGSGATEIRRAIRAADGCATRFVVNPDHAEGQSTSLRLGLRSTAANATAAAVLLGDQPGVSPALVDRVVRAFGTAHAHAARPVYAVGGGRPFPGHPVILAREIWDDMDSVQGDQGARHVLSAHPGWLLAVPVEGAPPADIDTWEDYRRTCGALT
jgi:molybdenum cofactor cytidylyltransferase